MNVPVMRGTIRRRVLLNFRADPAVVQAQLPPQFRPQLHQGQAIVGVCLIRLEGIRPALLPFPFGASSENAAHRIAVIWQDKNGETQQGVFIPRRDTSSRLNHFAGGRIFPGQHYLADFSVRDDANKIAFQMKSRDGEVAIHFKGEVAQQLPASSVFDSLNAASTFFERGSLGYSARRASNRLDGLRLETKSWRVEALNISEAFSSYYAKEKLFPKDSITFDHALLMRNIEHEWHAAKELDGD